MRVAWLSILVRVVATHRFDLHSFETQHYDCAQRFDKSLSLALHDPSRHPIHDLGSIDGGKIKAFIAIGRFTYILRHCIDLHVGQCI